MVTMQDVANRAGVALSTVSVALNGTHPVAPVTRGRIEDAMRDLGYQRNALARGLASRRSRVIALTYPMARSGISRTASEFVTGAAEAAQLHGYHLVLWPFAVSDGAGVAGIAREGLVEGVLVMEVHLQDARVRALRESGVPLALIGRTDDDAADRLLPTVDVDFDATLEDAVRHLAERGHRRIALVDHGEADRQAGHGPTVRAARAFQRAMAERGLAPQVAYADGSVAGGRRAVRTLMSEDLAPTAVVIMNEEAAFGVVAELTESGRQVPRDISLLAVVSSPTVSAQTVPPLTTLHAPGSELGRAGVEALLELLDTGQPPRTHLAPCRLVDCGSTGPAPRA